VVLLVLVGCFSAYVAVFSFIVASQVSLQHMKDNLVADSKCDALLHSSRCICSTFCCSFIGHLHGDPSLGADARAAAASALQRPKTFDAARAMSLRQLKVLSYCTRMGN
jgi:hypothetical protein